MTDRQPQSTQNIANQYDDDVMVPADPDAVIPWAEARDRLAGARSFWWATTRQDGRPHVRPVLAVLVDDLLYSTTNAAARKARNLAANPRCALTASTDDIDFMIEGTAAPVTDDVTLQRIADAYHAKYGWPVTVRGGAFHAPYGAPTAGSPPYQPYAVVPDVILGLGTNETYHCARPVGASERSHVACRSGQVVLLYGDNRVGAHRQRERVVPDALVAQNRVAGTVAGSSRRRTPVLSSASTICTPPF